MADPLRFTGTIAGLGTDSGVRVVVGHWHDSPYGAFADVMLAEPDGTRRLLAPTPKLADFIAATYTFDEVDVLPVEVAHIGARTEVVAGELRLVFVVGGRTALGRALRLVPRRLATAPAWSRVTDPVARVAVRGVRTRGSAGRGRAESYGAIDHHRIDSVHGTWRGRELGPLARVLPEPGFGFGSTPATPSVTTLVTTVSGA